MNDAAGRWPTVFPHLRYEKPGEMIDWLTTAFAFKEIARLERPDGGIVVSQLTGPAGGLVMVATLDDDFRHWVHERVPDQRDGTEPWPHLAFATSFLVDDVDAHADGARRAGATLLTEPTDQPWGLRTYAVIDPEGQHWQFAQLLRDVEPEEWGATRIRASP